MEERSGAGSTTSVGTSVPPLRTTVPTPSTARADLAGMQLPRFGGGQVDPRVRYADGRPAAGRAATARLAAVSLRAGREALVQRAVVGLRCPPMAKPSDPTA